MPFLPALFAVLLLVPSILGSSVEVYMKKAAAGEMSQEARILPKLLTSRDLQAVHPSADELVLLEQTVTSTVSSSHLISSLPSSSPPLSPPLSPPSSSLPLLSGHNTVSNEGKESTVSLLRQRLVTQTTKPSPSANLIETKNQISQVPIISPYNLTTTSALGCQGQPSKEKLAALLLYTFAGPAGDFYLGYTSLGIIKLAMLILPLWGLIALFRGDILSKPEEEDDADLSGGPETVFCSGLALFCLFISCLLAYLIWCIVDIVQVQNGNMKDSNGCTLT